MTNCSRIPDVDLVTLASPIKVHFEQGMKAIRAGKHVHFNKTMTISTAEATQLIEEAEKYGVKIVSSPGQMTAPALRRVRKAVLTGEIGIPSWTHRRLRGRSALALPAGKQGNGRGACPR